MNFSSSILAMTGPEKEGLHTWGGRVEGYRIGGRLDLFSKKVIQIATFLDLWDKSVVVISHDLEFILAGQGEPKRIAVLKSFELSAVNSSSEGPLELVDERFEGLFLDDATTIGFGELFLAAPEIRDPISRMVLNEDFSISGLYPVLKLRVNVCVPFDSYDGLKN